MRVIDIKRPTSGVAKADSLYLKENHPDPVLQPGYVLVRVKAFGLNRMDIMQREGVYPLKLPESAGKILGVEFGGLVEKLGEGCTADFKKGDRAFGLVYGSAYAELVAINEKMLMRIPPKMSFEEAAGIPETFFTAMQAVHLYGTLRKGDNILIHAGASGVGLSAIQLSKLGGANKIIVTAGTDEKCRLCESLGADLAINYKSADFAPAVEKATAGHGCDVIVDLVGHDYWTRNLQCVAPDGRIVLVASLSGAILEPFSVRDMLVKRLTVVATTLRARSVEYQIALKERFVEAAMGDPGIKVVVDRVYKWEDVGDAHRRMEGNLNAGKIICTID